LRDTVVRMFLRARSALETRAVADAAPQFAFYYVINVSRR